MRQAAAEVPGLGDGRPYVEIPVLGGRPGLGGVVLEEGVARYVGIEVNDV